MGFRKLIDFVAPIDEDYDENDPGELEVTKEEAKAIGSYEAPKSKRGRVSSPETKMVLFEPRSFDEAEEIARHLKVRRACVVNLHRLQRDYAQRTIDFLTGVVFALDGTIQKIAHNTILLTPSTVGVEGVISLEADE